MSQSAHNNYVSKFDPSLESQKISIPFKSFHPPGCMTSFANAPLQLISLLTNFILSYFRVEEVIKFSSEPCSRTACERYLAIVPVYYSIWQQCLKRLPSLATVLMDYSVWQQCLKRLSSLAKLCE